MIDDPSAPDGGDPPDAEQDALLRGHHDRLEAGARPHPEFATDLQRQLAATAAGDGARRWLFPAVAAALLLAALVGGAIAGGIFGVREVAQDLTQTPEPTLIVTSDDPSASPLATLSAEPTATSSPSASPTTAPTPTPTPTPTQTVAPTATPTARATPTPTPRSTATPGVTATVPLSTPLPTLPPDAGGCILALTEEAVPGYAADSTVARDERHYTFFWGEDQFEAGVQGETHVMVLDPRGWDVEIRAVEIATPLGTDTQAVGATDGLIYLFTPGAEPRTAVTIYDPATNAFSAPDPDGLDVQMFDAALGADGEIYLWALGLTIYRYDPATGSVDEVAERAWDAEGMVSDADGRLVFPGAEGVAIYNIEADDWEVLSHTAPWSAPRPPMAAGPDGRVLLGSEEDHGVWYFADGTWHFDPWLSRNTHVGAIGFVDGYWVSLYSEEPTRLRPGLYNYCLSGPAD